jgi:hypothetical protein
MTAARPATVEPFNTVFNEGRPILLLSIVRYLLLQVIQTGVPEVRRRWMTEDIGAPTLTARVHVMNCS